VLLLEDRFANGPSHTASAPVPCGNLSSVTAQAIEEVRLTAFKSFRGEVLRLAPLTVLIGRNSSYLPSGATSGWTNMVNGTHTARAGDSGGHTNCL
jgi:hypothetical protein